MSLIKNLFFCEHKSFWQFCNLQTFVIRFPTDSSVIGVDMLFKSDNKSKLMKSTFIGFVDKSE